MLNLNHTLQHLDISTTSVCRAIQTVRAMVGEGEQALRNASKLILDLINVTVSFKDENEARVTAQAVVEAVIKAKGIVPDEQALFDAAVKRADAHLKEFDWAYRAYESTDPLAVPETIQIEGTELHVEVKSDGKVKRGGKQLICAELFRKYVIESQTPCDNACFVQILIKEAGMSLAGARTYATNLRREHGMLIQKKKG